MRIDAQQPHEVDERGRARSRASLIHRGPHTSGGRAAACGPARAGLILSLRDVATALAQDDNACVTSESARVTADAIRGRCTYEGLSLLQPAAGWRLPSSDARSRALECALANRSLTLRHDSVLCDTFIEDGTLLGGPPPEALRDDVEAVSFLADNMQEMAFLHHFTDFASTVRAFSCYPDAYLDAVTYNESVRVLKVAAARRWLTAQADGAAELTQMPPSLMRDLNADYDLRHSAQRGSVERRPPRVWAGRRRAPECYRCGRRGRVQYECDDFADDASYYDDDDDDEYYD